MSDNSTITLSPLYTEFMECQSELESLKCERAMLVEALKLADVIFRFSSIGKCDERDILVNALSATSEQSAQWLIEKRSEIWQEVVAEWERPWGLSNGESFEVRMRRLAASKRKE